MGVRGGAAGRRARLLGAFLIIVGATIVATVTAPAPAEAAVVRSFTPRFRANDRGDIYAIGNTLVTCAASTTCTSAQGASGANLNNNDYIGAYVDVDGVAGTVNSSRATLTLPTGSAVLWAGLYWAGSAAAGVAARGTIQLAGPSGTYSTLSGTVTTGAAQTTGGLPYAGFADVTSLVQASGTYTVANLTTTVGQSNSRGGWSLVVVVRDSTQPLRNLSVFDGYAEINSSVADSVVTTTVSGFLTPQTGTVTARVGAVTSEGDLGLTGDAFQVLDNDTGAYTSLSDALNPAANFWNSSITRLGTRLTAKNPDYVNQMGFDVDYLTVPTGLINNGQTSATVRFTTGGESYEPIALFTAVDIYEPNLAVTKTVARVGGGTKVNPGDTVEYTVNLSSSGSEAAATTVVSDPLPAGINFVPGSITIDGATVTDAADTDRGQYTAGSRTVTARVGTGASGTAGGSLAVGTTAVVRFRATVDAAVAVAAQPANQASVAYNSPTTGTAYTALSDDPSVNGVPNATAIDVNDAPVANPVTVTTNEDTPVAISVAAATTDADDTVLSYTATAASGGTATCSGAGACTFTPPPNLAGTYTFTYTATDTGGRSATASVTITVNPVNDPPVASNDTATTAEDTAVSVTVTGNDTDIDSATLTVSGFTQGTRGTVACVAPVGGPGPCTSGALRYTPNPDANGLDAFTYVVSDGSGGTATATVTVTITAVNDPPVATVAAVTTREDVAVAIDVLDGDSDKDGDAVRLLSSTAAANGIVTCTANTGPCTYTPNGNFNGTDSFTYTITDRPGAGGLTSTATVTVTVTPVNDLPVAGTDALTTPEDVAATVNVLANDSDPDTGDVLRVVSFTQPAVGSPGTELEFAL